MNPRVNQVKPNPNHTITLIFANDEVRVFDVRPYLDRGIFQELKALRYFNTVQPCLGTVQWKNGQDFCPDTLYEESRPWSEALNSGLVTVPPSVEPELAFPKL